MSQTRQVLAFDFGASSGRAVLASLANGKISLKEVHRFPNEPVSCCGHLYWDVLRLFHEIKTGLRKAHEVGGFDSIGIDTWGVDYGLLDKHGALLGNPVHYRDRRTEGAVEAVSKQIAPDTLYQLTGNQIMPINTAFQLYTQQQTQPELLEQAQTFLLMPDLFAYLLTGAISSERTITGTTQLFDPNRNGWSKQVITALGLPEHLFPEIISTGTAKGMLLDELAQELDIPSVPVIAVCGHDTQCAAAAVPALDKNPFAFISCGTWALFGTELQKPVIHAEACRMELSNEAGYGNTFHFLKNITGLWLIQESRRTLSRKGKNISFADMEQLSAAAEGGVRFIDVDAPAFSVPGDMPERVRQYCLESGQPEPMDIGEILRCIYESLACKFRRTLSEMQACTGQTYQKIYMLGGGVKDALLCQLTADVCGIPVLTGPGEATAMGNAAIQFLAHGTVHDLTEVRQLIADSVPIKEYAPDPANAYIYDNYSKIF